MSQMDGARERLIEIYRRRAKHYDVTARLSPVPGYPVRAQRLRAIRALDLHVGHCVVDVACGTGLNFPLIEKVIGPSGRIVGVDLTDAMLAQARRRVEANGWGNVSLVQADVADFDFPPALDRILCTYALTQVPECARVITRGSASLSEGGRWVVLDLKLPANLPRWLTRFVATSVRPFASMDEWIERRPWDAIDAAVRGQLVDVSWHELCFGTAFLAAGTHSSRIVEGGHPDAG